MSRTGWKRVERSAAKLFKGKRFAANTGDRLDFETNSYVGQVKNCRTLSLRRLEALALEMARVGSQKSPRKIGAVVVKRSAGMGTPTPHLIVLTEGEWLELCGRLPMEEFEGA